MKKPTSKETLVLSATRETAKCSQASRSLWAKGRHRPERSLLNAVKEDHKPQQLEPMFSHAREQVWSLFLQENDEQGIDGEDYTQYLALDEDSNCEALFAYVDKGPEENVEAANPHAIDNDSDDDMGDTEADAVGTHDVHHQMTLSDWLDRIQSTALKSSYKASKCSRVPHPHLDRVPLDSPLACLKLK